MIENPEFLLKNVIYGAEECAYPLQEPRNNTKLSSAAKAIGPPAFQEAELPTKFHLSRHSNEPTRIYFVTIWPQ